MSTYAAFIQLSTMKKPSPRSVKKVSAKKRTAIAVADPTRNAVSSAGRIAGMMTKPQVVPAASSEERHRPFVPRGDRRDGVPNRDQHLEKQNEPQQEDPGALADADEEEDERQEGDLGDGIEHVDQGREEAAEPPDPAEGDPDGYGDEGCRRERCDDPSETRDDVGGEGRRADLNEAAQHGVRGRQQETADGDACQPPSSYQCQGGGDGHDGAEDLAYALSCGRRGVRRGASLSTGRSPAVFSHPGRPQRCGASG
jgi:hypothetical protein